MAKKFTYEDAVDFVTRNSDAVMLEPEWRGSAVPIRFRCSCGTEFTTTYNRFQSQNKRTCDACGRRAADAAKRLTLAEVCNMIRQNSDCEYVSGEYKNRKSRIRVRCSCGEEFETTLDRLLHYNGSGACAKCGIKQRNRLRKHTLESVRETAIRRGAELVSKEYQNAHQLLTFRCECGAEFRTTFNRFLTSGKVRCNACSGYESNGEYRIRKWLIANDIPFVAQKTFLGCGSAKRPYFFDFYLPEFNLCIEFDGRQHFEAVDFSGHQDEDTQARALWDLQCRDLVKDIYCEEHGIGLLRIRYDESERIEDILGSTLIPR